MIPTLRVGIPIPTDPPTTGGGFEFQETIFREILQRSIGNATSGRIHYIPIAVSAKSARLWNIPEHQVLRAPGLLSKLYSAVHRKALAALDILGMQRQRQFVFNRLSRNVLQGQIDILWNLSPSTVSDQVPYVTTIWDLQHRLQPFFPEVSQSGEWEAREKFFTNVTQRASLCIVGTNRGKSELQKFYGIDDARILVNPFPCPDVCQKLDGLHPRHPLSSVAIQGRYLLYPAQFWTHKNHMGALYALRELRKRKINLRLVLTGSDKGGLPSIRSLISELDLSSQVINLGFVSREALASLYSDCFALLYPSFFGPDNIPPLEAMSYAAPALVADVPGAREQYGDAALYFNPTSYIDMADAIQRLVDDRDLRSLLILRGTKLVSRLTPSAYVDIVEDALMANTIPFLCASRMHS